MVIISDNLPLIFCVGFIKWLMVCKYVSYGVFYNLLII